MIELFPIDEILLVGFGEDADGYFLGVRPNIFVGLSDGVMGVPFLMDQLFEGVWNILKLILANAHLYIYNRRCL